MMRCKGTCVLYCVSTRVDGRMYNGRKRCMTCEAYFETHGNFCPCCGTKMRNGPRNNRYRGRNTR